MCGCSHADAERISSLPFGPASRRADLQPRSAFALHIQHQPLALAAGAADHHPLVFGLLFLAQDRVAVLGNSGNDALLAGAANAELARIIDVDALVEQHLQDRLAFRNEEFLAGALQLDGEAALL